MDLATKGEKGSGWRPLRPGRGSRGVKNYNLDSDMKNGKRVELQTRTWTPKRWGDRKNCRSVPGLRNKEGEASWVADGLTSWTGAALELTASFCLIKNKITYSRIDRRDVRNKIEAMQLLFKRSYLDHRVNLAFERYSFWKIDIVPKLLSERHPKKTKKETNKKERIALSY
jgi:hypothetical protein